ncbi:MAG: hypothetical protein JWP79_2653 [Polaromonas sp.]|jgi:hypothetical protein|nr:hypothetical protein [Polaromonas sp.]MDB5939619.1 hypothetical protein [Polaromonas sp.]
MKNFSIVFFVVLYSGLLLLINAESTVAFFLASLALSLVAIYKVCKYVKDPGEICLFDFFATSLLIAYALSSLTTQVKIYSLLSMDVAHYFRLSQHSLSVALASVAFASAILLLLSQLFPAKTQLCAMSQRQCREATVLIAMVLGAAIYCIATGLMQFQGILFNDTGNTSISPLASLTYFAIPPAGIMAVFMASGNHEINRFNRWLLYAMAIALWLVSFTQARRMLVYMAALYLVFYAFNAYGRAFWLKKAVFAAAVIPVAYFGIKLFFAFRIAVWEMPPGTNDPFRLLNLGLEIFSNPNKYDLDILLNENSLERPFVLKYLSMMIERVSFDKWLWGEALYATLLYSIPSAFIGAKHYLIDEDLIHPRIGLPIVDEANTILTAGMADFGWPGLLLFPVFMLLILKLLLLVVKKSGIGWFVYFTLFGVLTVLLNVENSMAQYWSFARSILIFLVLTLGARYLVDAVSFRRRNIPGYSY